MGVGGTDFRRAFRDLTNSHNPDIFIITETRLNCDRATVVISSLGFDRYIKVDAMSFFEGIWVLWNP